MAVSALKHSPIAAPFEAIVVVPAFDMYAACADAAGGRVVLVPLGDGFAFPLSEVLAAITPRTRVGVPDQPEQPDRRADSARRHRRDCRGGAAGTGASSTRPTPTSPSETLIGDAAFAGAAQRRRRPHVREGLRAGRASRRRAGRRPRDAGAAAPAVPPYSSTSARRSRCRRRSKTPPTSTGTSRKCAESRALLYAALERLGVTLLAERRQLRAGALRRRSRRGDRRRSRRGRSHPRSVARSGVRRLRAHHGRRGRTHGALRCRARGGPVRRGIIKRVTTETSIALKLDLDGRGRYEVSTGIRFFDHMLELVTRHGGFDLTLAVEGRPRRRSAPHRRRRRHRARRSGVDGARHTGAASIAPATS